MGLLAQIKTAKSFKEVNEKLEEARRSATPSMVRQCERAAMERKTQLSKAKGS